MSQAAFTRAVGTKYQCEWSKSNIAGVAPSLEVFYSQVCEHLDPAQYVVVRRCRCSTCVENSGPRSRKAVLQSRALRRVPRVAAVFDALAAAFAAVVPAGKA